MNEIKEDERKSDLFQNFLKTDLYKTLPKDEWTLWCWIFIAEKKDNILVICLS